MAATFAWPEGRIYLWTGTATASALVAYAERVYGTLAYGVDNFRTLYGTYHNLLTGQRADVYIGALYTKDMLTLQRMADAQTGVHAHLNHSGYQGSAGYFLYSGAINSVGVVGREGDIIRVTFSYQANAWSA